jgi:hypothetical protein
MRMQLPHVVQAIHLIKKCWKKLSDRKSMSDVDHEEWRLPII